MEPSQSQPTMPPNPLPLSSQPKPQNNTKIWIAVGVFVLIVSVLITYQSQQSKMERLNKQIASLKTEVKALGGTTTSQKLPVSDDGIPIASGIQSNARDSERQSDILSIQLQLEVFYQDNGYYPSRSDMNNSAWLGANMKNLDQDALIDPSNPTGSKTLAMSAAVNFYSYEVKNANGTDCEADHTVCVKYTLTTTLENTFNGSKTITKSNLD